MSGKCQICGKVGQLQRTYFHYNIKCECHSPNHVELVDHCVDCTPVEKRTTRPELLTENIRMDNHFKSIMTDEEFNKYTTEKVTTPNTPEPWMTDAKVGELWDKTDVFHSADFGLKIRDLAAQHYEPLLEAKDAAAKGIAELYAKEIERLKAQLTANDAEIAEIKLFAEKDCDKKWEYYGKMNHLQVENATLKSEVERLNQELLKHELDQSKRS